MTRFKIQYPPGLCSMAALSLAFNARYDEILILLKGITRRPEAGITTQQLRRAISYGCYIYNCVARAIVWRGKLSQFVQEYPRGRYIINCAGHVTFISDGIVFDKRKTDYDVYGAWMIYNNSKGIKINQKTAESRFKKNLNRLPKKLETTEFF